MTDTNANTGPTAQRYRYQSEIQSMMYTFGDVKVPLSGTTLLVEDIVHSQIVEMLLKATAVAYRRGARVLSPEDLLFLIRHDVHRSSRLKEFLSWKDVRKNAKPAQTTPSGQATDDLAEINEEDAKQLADSNSNTNNNTVTNQSTPSPQAAALRIGGPRRRQLGLFWELSGALVADVFGPQWADLPATAAILANANSPLQQAACQRETMRRLRQADLLTQSMSQAEYMEYSECRQASFTYKKARKFREWLTGGTARPGTLGLAVLAGGAGRELARLSDETLEILGFLAYEMVQRLTEVSLAVKWETEQHSHSGNVPVEAVKKTRTGMSSLFVEVGNIERESNTAVINATTTQPQQPQQQQQQKTPLMAAHIEEAYRRLECQRVGSGRGAMKGGLNGKRRLLI